MDQCLDITGATIVEVKVRDDGKVLWVNIDGVCRLRVCRIETLALNIPASDKREIIES